MNTFSESTKIIYNDCQAPGLFWGPKISERSCHIDLSYTCQNEVNFYLSKIIGRKEKHLQYQKKIYHNIIEIFLQLTE